MVKKYKYEISSNRMNLNTSFLLEIFTSKKGNYSEEPFNTPFYNPNYQLTMLPKKTNISHPFSHQTLNENFANYYMTKKKKNHHFLLLLFFLLQSKTPPINHRGRGLQHPSKKYLDFLIAPKLHSHS